MNNGKSKSIYIQAVFIIQLFSATLFLTQSPAQQPNLKTENVVVVFKTHFDIGYTDLAGSVISKYQTSMIEGALTEIERSQSRPANEHFTWTLPAWPMLQILQGSNNEIKEKVVRALKDNYLTVHALPFTIETETSDLENLARMFLYSSEISGKYELALPRDSKMTDVPEHSWILPTLLSNAGIRFLHLGCNAASSSPEVPVLFWWEGPDGSRLLTMYWEKYYGTDIVPPEDWPYKSWIAIMHTNDNQGAPAPEVVAQTLEDIKRLNPNAKVSLGRMSDFYDLILRENPDIPVIKKDMPDTWVHGYMSMPKEVKISRRIRKDMFNLDILNTSMNLWNTGNSDISDVINKAAESSLLFDEHTFGLAMSHGHSGTWRYGDEFRVMKTENIFEPIEMSWKEKGSRILEAERLIRPGLNDKLRDLANSIKVNEKHITVYNPLPWDRNGEAILQTRSVNIKSGYLKDLTSGEIIPLANEGNVIRFSVKAIPAMGYKTYVPVESSGIRETSLKTDTEKNIIENSHLKIIIDSDKGGISSIINKKDGREMVKPNSEFVFGGFMYERFGKENTDEYTHDYIKGGWEWAIPEMGRPGLSADNYKKIHPRPDSITYKIDKVKASAILRFRTDEYNPYDYSLIYTLYEDRPYAEIQWGISGKTPEPWPEAGWITFPFNIDNPDFKLGRLGAVVDPAKDFIMGSNADYYFVNTGLAVIGNDRKGYGISSPDVPAISLDRPGLWKYTRGFIPEKPNVFFNLFNNQWSTNFTEWIEGSWSARFYIWPVDQFDNEKSIITPSEEFRQPLMAVFSEGMAGKLSETGKGPEVSMKGVLITSFGKNPYGEGLILRIWEQAGNNGKCTISLPTGLNGMKAMPVNLRGEKTGEPFMIENNRILIDVHAYKPYSFQIL